MRQRSRWARGMFEGIRANPPQHQPRVIAKLVAGIDYLVPFLDIGYVFFWIPGLILVLFGYPLIVSWWSMLIIPITLVVYNCCAAGRNTTSSAGSASHPERDRRGFFGYLFVYQVLTSVASLRGYAQYVLGARPPLEVTNCTPAGGQLPLGVTSFLRFDTPDGWRLPRPLGDLGLRLSKSLSATLKPPSLGVGSQFFSSPASGLSLCK